MTNSSDDSASSKEGRAFLRAFEMPSISDAALTVMQVEWAHRAIEQQHADTAEKTLRGDSPT